MDREPSYAVYLERIMLAPEVIGGILGRMAVEAVAKKITMDP